MMSLRPILILTALVCVSTTVAGEPAATLKLPPVFSSHMVLQRERPVPIWGTASPGLKITVVFRDQTKTTTAGADGKWKVTLDALTAWGPDTLKVNPDDELSKRRYGN
jgi:sialate O-acetylesterase